MSSDLLAGPIRDNNPCKDCPDKPLRPGCRKNCEKDAQWHKEVERVNGNRRNHYRQWRIRIYNKKQLEVRCHERKNGKEKAR